MFVDLNVPVPAVTPQTNVQSKKQKGKQPQTQQPAAVFTPAQLSALEARIDLLIHLGYTVLALNQTVQKKVDPKTHVNVLDPLLQQLRKRVGVAFIKRLTIVLDEESEKGFGLTTGNVSLFTPYDIIALAPTTATSFSLACLTHTLPSPLTAHIIALPLTLPRLPFNLRHTLVGTALKNGAAFEIAYSGALGGEGDPGLGASGGEGGSAAKRNWWAAAREVVRVTKGKGIVVSGGVVSPADLRAPRDVANLIAVLGLAQDRAHDASSKTPQSLILRAQTRKTYRAVFSEPKVVIPESYSQASSERPAADEVMPALGETVTIPEQASEVLPEQATPTKLAIAAVPAANGNDISKTSGKKRGRAEDDGSRETPAQTNTDRESAKRKKKRIKSKDGQAV